MKRYLPFIVLLLAIIPPLLILVDVQLRKNIEERQPTKLPSTPIASSVEQMVEEARSSSKDASPTGQQPNAFPAPKTQSIRGWYKAFGNGVISLDTGSSTLSVRIGEDAFSVCTPRYWTNPDGQKFDLTQVWFDMSNITLTNFRSAEKNETEASFAIQQKTMTKDTHLMIFALESPQDTKLFAKKVWIVGCQS